MSKIKIGKKLYIVVDELGGEIFVTRDEARNFKKTVGAKAVVIEAPITPWQQKAIRCFEQDNVRG